MLDAEQIDNWHRDKEEALFAAKEFARRKRKGLPPDRFASSRQLHLVAEGIDALRQIIDWQNAVIEGMSDDS
ncbi:hypothetical protein Q0601_00940 [Paracoccus onubensis]|uniref:hypothetical protein n=1 Tax=Paracoccus onubensis TaxID=1675788 RepID=UPI0027310988|nr:hypothetical protein [Paracoccus onubensis]MDP0925728.1 hypothetical protein [Paracoccus onubensis]